MGKIVFFKRLYGKYRITPWLIGVLLSTVAMFLGYDLGSQTASLLGGEPGIWARMGKGFVWGGVIACLQWLIVRAVGVPPIRFIVASAVGFAAGYPLGQTVQLIFVHHWGLHLTGYWSAVATFGFFLSMPQWWTFRRHIKRASLWVLFSMTGWTLTGLVWLNGGRGGFEYGIVTGLGLAWLVYSQQRNVKSQMSHSG